VKRSLSSEQRSVHSDVQEHTTTGSMRMSFASADGCVTAIDAQAHLTVASKTQALYTILNGAMYGDASHCICTVYTTEPISCALWLREAVLWLSTACFRQKGHSICCCAEA
jgi:hypothetical protein